MKVLSIYSTYGGTSYVSRTIIQNTTNFAARTCKSDETVAVDISKYSCIRPSLSVADFIYTILRMII